MRICEKLKAAVASASSDPVFSFEFFPPKNEEGLEQLFVTLGELRAFDPAYVSVTYGAGGTTRDLTVDLVRRIQDEVGLLAMAHLTCVGATTAEIGSVLDQMRAAGIENVLALRGDPPKGQSSFEKTEGGFGYASELVEYVRGRGDFCIAGACYPETHPEAASADADLDALKKKVDAGADFLITQLFFDTESYLRFFERAQAAGIDVPIIAGIMPVTGVAQTKRFTTMCGASIPAELLARLEPHENDKKAVRAIGVEHATRQCERLLAAGVPGIHFYTLNRSLATREILTNLRSPA